MAIEYEIKFQANPSILEAVARQYAHLPSQQFDMQTTYYDTPSGALSARFYTLRRRQENEKSICTLKVPAEEGARKELEVPCAQIQDAIDPLCRMGAPADFLALTREGLIPVCGAKFHRTAITLTAEGYQLEIALDQGILTGGDKQIPLCELEIELKEGTKLDAKLFAAELMLQYGLQQETRSKFRRALSLYEGG